MSKIKRQVVAVLVALMALGGIAAVEVATAGAASANDHACC